MSEKPGEATQESKGLLTITVKFPKGIVMGGEKLNEISFTEPTVEQYIQAEAEEFESSIAFAAYLMSICSKRPYEQFKQLGVSNYKKISVELSPFLGN